MIVLVPLDGQRIATLAGGPVVRGEHGNAVADRLDLDHAAYLERFTCVEGDRRATPYGTAGY